MAFRSSLVTSAAIVTFGIDSGEQQMNDAEIEALEAQYRKAVYPSHVPGGNNIVFDSNLIEKGVRNLLDEVKDLRLLMENGAECLRLAITERESLKLQLSGERERCAKIVEEFDGWVWPDKKSESYREAGDWAGPDTTESLKRLASEIRTITENGKDEICQRPQFSPHDPETCIYCPENKRKCEHGDWIPVAGHALRCGKCNTFERTNLA